VKIGFHTTSDDTARFAGIVAAFSKALKVSKAKGVTPAVPSED
jgi:hypothetical protein